MTTSPRLAATDAGIANGPTRPATGGAFIHWLDAPAELEGGLAALGGKAASLVRLGRGGLPVPPGFVVLPAAFDTTAASSNGALRLLPEAEADVCEAYAALARRLGQEDPPVAVRSSATTEDLEDASFAGQHDTFLGVRGAGDVLDYAARCAASLWSAHAASYRTHREAAGQGLPEAAMAVVVQELVDAEAAGVAFTADPIAHDRDHVVVNASWGLGQSIVDGEVEGDTWQVDRAALVVTHEKIGVKATRTGAGPGAPRVPVPEAAQRQACLHPENAAEVARLALRAEEVLGRPADVEWALAAGKIFVLQARPITALRGGWPVPGAGGDGELPAQAVSTESQVATEAPRGPTPEFPFEWPAPDVVALHWRLDGGASATPIRPWDEEEREAAGRAGRVVNELLGGERYRRSITLNGYRYTAEAPFPATPEERESRRRAFERPLDALQERGATYWEAVLLPEIDEGDRRIDAVEPDRLSPADLADHLVETLGWHGRLWGLHSVALRTIRGQPNTFRRRFAALCQESTGQASDDQVATLLANVPNKLSAAIDGLIDLARIVQQHAPLRRLFETTPAADILARLAETDGGAIFEQRLGRLLAEQGLRSDAGAFTVRRGSQPGWRDRPELVISLVQRYVPQDLDALAQAHKAAVAARDAQAAALRATLADEAAQQRFDALLDAARREARAYEDHNYYIDCAAGALMHRALMAAGRRLAGAGILPSAEDAWWLHRHEITAALRALQEENDGAAVHRPRWDLLVQSRQTLHEWQRSLTPPDWLGVPPPPAAAAPPAGGGGMAAPAAPATEQSAAPPNMLVRGQPGSRGVATGRVRLVPRDVLVPEVEPGDVLVARNAGVLWTPVFPVAAAVVLDEGVLFQHAMLTCREYGVPGVFQAKQATTTLHEGQLVTVDGTNGWVLAAGEP